MSMPRYKYAIGNAPVRFPSPKPPLPQDEAAKQITSQANPSHARVQKGKLQPHDESLKPATLRPSRWSMFSLASTEDTNDGHIKRASSHEDIRAPSPERQRSKSIHGDRLSATRATAPEEAPKHRSKRVTWLSSSRDQSPSGRSTQSERASLLKSPRQDEMSQGRSSPLQGPQKSFRPSSLFWLDQEEQGKGKAKQRERTFSHASYGSIKQSTSRSSLASATSEAPIDSDDPYGYRALAGPALLPTFHSNLKQRQQEQEGASFASRFVTRTCTVWPFVVLTFMASIAVAVLYFI